jgi:DNA-binding response OmpR family regulator
MPLLALLIEDNPGDARLIQEMLKDEGGAEVQLEWTDNLDDGVRRVLKGGVDVVLLDLGLPDSQGLDTVATVHLFDSVVPIVVLTGLADQDVSVKAVRAGAQDYLVKGKFDGATLVRTVRFAVERMTQKQV